MESTSISGPDSVSVTSKGIKRTQQEHSMKLKVGEAFCSEFPSGSRSVVRKTCVWHFYVSEDPRYS